MASGRFILISITLLATSGLFSPDRAAAFWGFGSDRNIEKSGLDFNSGYDVNTVSTISGRVAAAPYSNESGNVVIEIKTGTETVFVGVGPSSYWQKNGVAINPDDEITVRGSKAVGKDGKTYLLTRKLINHTAGTEVEMRSETGEAVWMRSGPARAGSPSSPMNRGNSVIRSGNGMMRGGGAGMRR